MLAYYQWAPRGESHYAVLDRSYQVVARIRARNGYTINTHELQLTRWGSAYLSAYEPVRLEGWCSGRLVGDGGRASAAMSLQRCIFALGLQGSEVAHVPSRR